ncbi:hypothetical protein JOQ06_021785 [Pogonophryne albipinna]|uniref:Reverse transcriptase n=1 Tax=Pogonophryne albipinna TaxID=1090488 RepID=A0AAD6ABZ4_9TELE|nr:hypothetical protein JOQ06_021785 [Pogonophryne albipinna]
MQERSKGALVRARFTKLQDIDTPTAFFFSLEKSVVKRKQMLCLRLPEGKVTTEPAEMRKHAVDFYTDLFKADECDVDSAEELLQGLPQLSSEEQNTLSSELTFDELTAAVSQMASGKAPGIDGLSSDFFKHFWSLMGQDICYVFKECFEEGMLPASSRRAVLSLLPKKGDLTSLKKQETSGSFIPPVVVSAYADDINIIIQGHTDVQELKESLALYEKASSARVNWGKSEAV